ncbi:hypothetical protein pdam_00017748 [Pocillopora damicornis]|uniref:RAWUL domain-containing protein n=1 Tax=Pocillopora damicornis TaxID=46731 RepID=A0A3M6TJ01_POCDA|nr:hypothetical protein pdam_00017748 [Pocillopora damicornis]
MYRVSRGRTQRTLRKRFGCNRGSAPERVCKSCLVRHIELVNRCPTCNNQIHESQPLYNIRLDRTMQDIVYKLLPKVEKEEKRRERKFYKDRGMPYPDPKGSQTPTSAGSRPLKATKKYKGAASKTSKTTKVKSYHRTDEQISLQLETYRSQYIDVGYQNSEHCVKQTGHDEEEYLLSTKGFLDGSMCSSTEIEPLPKKFIRLSTHVTIGLLQKFLAWKLHLDSENMVRRVLY